MEKRKNNNKAILLLIILSNILLTVTSAFAEDWPTRLHDMRRGGITSEQLQMPLSLAWIYETDNAPEPAWTESPALHDYYHYFDDLKPRQSFDFSFDVAAADGFVYFGSSKTGEVTCIELSSGQIAWTFFTEGPVRFVPTVVSDKVYFGSDDGKVYCLNAADGSVIWSSRVGGPDMIWGNEHMISVWPVRSSVLVDGDDVFWAAGIFPEEGMYLCKRNASDGTGGWTVTPKLPPQGYLLATDDKIFVPSGKTYPMVYNRNNGSFAGYINKSTRDGGAWALISPDNKDIWVGPGINNAPQQFSTSTRTFMASISDGNYLIADMTHSYFNTDTRIVKINRADRSQVWAIEETYPYSIIKGGSILYAGGDGKVSAFNSSDGHELWSVSVDGKVYGLAVADNCLFVSTDKGSIYCFSSLMPAVTNGSGAIVQDTNTAELHGDLLSQGASETRVMLYWGTTDGQMETKDWDNVTQLGVFGPGEISKSITGLQSESVYYYRYCAINDSGNAWASKSDVFITGQISLQSADANASEAQADTGRFILNRPAWSIGVELIINYNVNGTATPDSDYEALTGKVVFPAGHSSTTLDVNPIDDKLIGEDNETVIVTLTQGAYLEALQNSGSVVITDDDNLENYQHKMKLQFAGYTGSATLVDFPALVMLNDSLDGFSYSQLSYVNGSDLRFVSSDLQTFLSHEFEQWDISGASQLWVSVPEISSSDSYIWLYWGNTDCVEKPVWISDGSVWSDDYANIWYMNNEAGVVDDISLNSNNGTVSGNPTEVQGIAGQALKFDGSGDFVSLDKPLAIGSKSNTVSAFMRIPSVGAGGLASGERVGVVLGNYNNTPNTNWELSNVGQMRIYWNGGNPNAYGIDDLRNNNWHHLAWVRDKHNNAFYLYVDGRLDNTISTAGSDISFNSSSKIGADNRGSSTPYFHGSIDEFRISSVARSADWLTAATDNYKDNASFIRYGSSVVENNSLVAYWPFDDSVDNAQGNSVYNGFIVGNAVISSDDVVDGNGSLKIDDRNSDASYVKITTSPFAGNEQLFTVVGWYKYKDISGDGSDERPFVFETDNYKVSYGCRLSGDKVEIGEWYLLGSPGWSDTSGPVVEVGIWHHVALVYNANDGVAKHYVDGQLRDEVIGTAGSGLSSTSYLNIGNHRSGDGSRNFDGYIDEMAVYSIELTEAQIQALFERQYSGQSVNPGNVLDFDIN